MKIKDEREYETSTYFEDLNPGDVYEFDNKILMKVEPIIMSHFTVNCISLKDGLAHMQDLDSKITPLMVQLNIIREV